MLTIFAGPDAYISPRWIAGRANEVPTWNYTTVHCSGTARVVEGDEKLALMRQLVDRMEAGEAGAWAIDELPQAQLGTLLAGIVVFTIQVERVRAKFKLSQNSPGADRTAIIAALLASGNPRDAALAKAMRAAPERPS